MTGALRTHAYVYTGSWSFFLGVASVRGVM